MRAKNTLPTSPPAPMRMDRYKNESYEDAVEYLMDYPEDIEQAWGDPAVERGGCLFAYASLSGYSLPDVGCLSMLKGPDGYTSQFSEEITREIKEDDRIPNVAVEITPAHLSVFREWQQRLDVLAAERLKAIGFDNG